MLKKRFLLIICMLAVTVSMNANQGNAQSGNKSKSGRKILVEEFKDRNTGCVITYEYYKNAEGKKILHGKYKRQWSLPKGERGNWSGRENITATFVENRLNGVVTINCEKYKWQRKSEFIKGKGRKVSLVAVESYIANNLQLTVKNDTLAGTFNFELGNLKYEAMGKINESGEMQGKYTLYKRNTTEQTSNPRNIGQDWVIEEQYLCDPDYTYRDADPKVKEVILGYPGTSRGEQIRIKIPRLRLSISSK
ncbi:hypothetical protein JGH11_02450 [Dysgonomonas sp. Marseille-P4677]|uniref:hypothetical protein n=1 Tax=Dysgonomonas sp. Marseille-P4677 TaxID=2364790 RepID=UPI0019114AB9|nr:hypothetical protein [Dysgonomonas sp. Marseille-P4677]MBK5719727.1 hypothetical protein [Dysgonomonas sp. Marseille-P4677]